MVVILKKDSCSSLLNRNGDTCVSVTMFLELILFVSNINIFICFQLCLLPGPSVAVILKKDSCSFLWNRNGDTCVSVTIFLELILFVTHFHREVGKHYILCIVPYVEDIKEERK